MNSERLFNWKQKVERDSSARILGQGVLVQGHHVEDNEDNFDFIILI